MFFTKWIPNLEKTRPNYGGLGRVRCYKLPPLAEARNAFSKVYPTFTFDNVGEQETAEDVRGSLSPGGNAAESQALGSVTKLVDFKHSRL
jgi:hypothetical protein